VVNEIDKVSDSARSQCCSTPPGGIEGPRTLDYFSGGRPWKALEGAGRIVATGV